MDQRFPVGSVAKRDVETKHPTGQHRPNPKKSPPPPCPHLPIHPHPPNYRTKYEHTLLTDIAFYDPDAIYDPNGPLDPLVMEEAVGTIMRGIEPDLSEPPDAVSRRMHAALRALAGLHPRNEPELMLGVQALNAYHAANAAWRRATQPGEQRRHAATAASATRTFDAMLRALERRQAKPLSVPIGRPPAKDWQAKDLKTLRTEMENRWRLNHQEDVPDPVNQHAMTDDELVTAWSAKARELQENPNQGLDIANTEGILPDGSMIMPWNPTPQQAAYIDRRLIMMYVRERAENRRNGINSPIQFRPTRTGDIVP
jgi:hypothetical protein